MPDVQIQISVDGQPPGVPGKPVILQYAAVDPATEVSVSLNNNAGVTEYFWEFVDKPKGAEAVVFSDPTASSPTFTPVDGVVGSYLLACTVNRGDSYGRNGLAFLTDTSNLRKIATGEGGEFSSSKGWTEAINDLIDYVKDGVPTGPSGPSVPPTSDSEIYVEVGDDPVINAQNLYAAIIAASEMLPYGSPRSDSNRVRVTAPAAVYLWDDSLAITADSDFGFIDVVGAGKLRYHDPKVRQPELSDILETSDSIIRMESESTTFAFSIEDAESFSVKGFTFETEAHNSVAPVKIFSESSKTTLEDCAFLPQRDSRAVTGIDGSATTAHIAFDGIPPLSFIFHSYVRISGLSGAEELNDKWFRGMGTLGGGELVIDLGYDFANGYSDISAYVSGGTIEFVGMAVDWGLGVSYLPDVRFHNCFFDGNCMTSAADLRNAVLKKCVFKGRNFRGNWTDSVVEDCSFTGRSLCSSGGKILNEGTIVRRSNFWGQSCGSGMSIRGTMEDCDGYQGFLRCSNACWPTLRRCRAFNRISGEPLTITHSTSTNYAGLVEDCEFHGFAGYNGIFVQAVSVSYLTRITRTNFYYKPGYTGETSVYVTDSVELSFCRMLKILGGGGQNSLPEGFNVIVQN